MVEPQPFDAPTKMNYQMVTGAKKTTLNFLLHSNEGQWSVPLTLMEWTNISQLAFNAEQFEINSIGVSSDCVTLSNEEFLSLLDGAKFSNDKLRRFSVYRKSTSVNRALGICILIAASPILSPLAIILCPVDSTGSKRLELVSNSFYCYWKYSP